MPHDQRARRLTNHRGGGTIGIADGCQRACLASADRPWLAAPLPPIEPDSDCPLTWPNRRSLSRRIVPLTADGDSYVPESESEFFSKVVDTQVTFTKNEKGEVTGLVLHQGGRDITVNRVK
jgi:hypothetical protein